MNMKTQLVLKSLAERTHQEKESVRTNYIDIWTPPESKFQQVWKAMLAYRPKQKPKAKSQPRQPFKRMQHDLS